MYDYIKGQVTRITHEYITLEQHGIGYHIATPNPYAFEVALETVQVFTHLHVREDAQTLFGFVDLEQRELFRKLIQVSGIGPKGALAILAIGEPMHVVEAIEREDDAFLVKFPGVGKKTARQMVLDLKGKLGEFNSMAPQQGLFASVQEEVQKSGALEEAMLALMALGYSEKELRAIEGKLLEENDNSTTDFYMKKALQLLLKF